ncbi:DUF1127 domain-containing protein [Ketogulonicigenium vulgare]|uniref:YjiS-like domain-containing protein n=1 Tax=Ketogulonicigenium vulgare (strain WSH-001) TaxID=759362 RepID=F9Y3L0_KETVW|nr:DUF1127 domain-containing protein [Ketogulonicigenium vulgare]AEM41630.1 hypothetical protein KVU_1791 [Ketogulonicigenium vulgare WSH-001]ALJ82400.1 hypothetical protein KVH_11570 [Ketogulonicigenium vulgare]
MSRLVALTSPVTARVSLIARLAFALRVRQERRHLVQLDDHLLKDLGLSRDEVQAEAGRKLWDTPKR